MENFRIQKAMLIIEATRAAADNPPAIVGFWFEKPFEYDAKENSICHLRGRSVAYEARVTLS